MLIFTLQLFGCINNIKQFLICFDRLLYAVLPHWVANELRHKRKVAPMRFENVTILFSGLVGFSSVSTGSKKNCLFLVKAVEKTLPFCPIVRHQLKSYISFANVVIITTKFQIVKQIGNFTKVGIASATKTTDLCLIIGQVILKSKTKQIGVDRFLA